MPAPPNVAGTEMPSRPSDAICGRMPLSKRCSRSSSLMRGATSRPAHSRTDFSRSVCSSVRSKFNIGRGIVTYSKLKAQSVRTEDADRGTAGGIEEHRGVAAINGDLEVAGTPEERAG